jgi:hypothetical protein
VKSNKKINDLAGHHWLTPVIPTTQEAKIGRVMDYGQPRKKVSKTLSQSISLL